MPSKPSPTQIRARASLAFRNRMRHGGPGALLGRTLRRPIAGETPLSAAEIRHGIEHGLIAWPGART